MQIHFFLYLYYIIYLFILRVTAPSYILTAKGSLPSSEVLGYLFSCMEAL